MFKWLKSNFSYNWKSIKSNYFKRFKLGKCFKYRNRFKFDGWFQIQTIASFSVLTLNDLNTTTTTTGTTTLGVNHHFLFSFKCTIKLLCCQTTNWISNASAYAPNAEPFYKSCCSLFTNNIEFPFVSLMMWR